MACQEFHELGERGALLLVVMRPEGLENEFPVLHEAESEQVFKAVGVERVALHVEEKVARIRFWQPGKASARFALNQFDFILASPPFMLLECRLRSQSLEDLDSSRGCGFRQAMRPRRRL